MSNTPDTTPDHQLSPEQLDGKYNPNGDGEHPRHTRDMWRDWVANEDTLDSYWQWLAFRLDEDHRVEEQGKTG